MKLKCLQNYRCLGLRARVGDIFEVDKSITQEKAKQLLRDFPSRWEVVTDKKEESLADSRDNPRIPDVSLGDQNEPLGALWRPAKEKGKVICLLCGRTFSKRGIRGHITKMHPEAGDE